MTYVKQSQQGKTHFLSSNIYQDLILGQTHIHTQTIKHTTTMLSNNSTSRHITQKIESGKAHTPWSTSLQLPTHTVAQAHSNSF